MAPGAAGLPAAEATVPVADRMAGFLSVLPPRTLRIVRLGLRAFDWLPFPYRFSRLGLEARERYLADLDGAHSALVGDLLLLLKVVAGLGYAADPRVAAAVGYEARCRLAGRAKPPAHPSLGELEPAPGGEDCDVAIVGSGAGGAAAALVLAEAGLDVLVVEAGPHLNRDSYPDDPLEAIPALYRAGGLTIAEGRPAIPVPVGRAVGGTTVINSGTCFRAPPDVMERWRREFGVHWATDLEDEFETAERLLKVAPVSERRMGRNGQLCMEGARALGASGGPIARNAGRCVQCSSCPIGCPLDAKQAMHVSYLPRAVAAGARIRAGVEVDRVMIEGVRATGLDCRVAGPDGQPWRVNARRAVLVAGGALGTPELLIRTGLGDRGGQLGRNLRIHPACWVGARYAEEVRGWDGIMQSYYVDEWHDRGLILEATFTPLAFGAQWLPGIGSEHQGRLRDYGNVASIGVHLSDRSSGRVGLAGDGSLRLTYRLTTEDARTLQYGIARAAEIHFAAGATEVYPQIAGIPAIGRGDLAGLESARVRRHRLRLEAFHPMGTARMGNERSAATVATDGAIRGVQRLYVCDASLFPTSLGVNPMMTVIACSTRIARGLADRLA
jgi:choline dehydrogenase-like flavoprotein